MANEWLELKQEFISLRAAKEFVEYMTLKEERSCSFLVPKEFRIKPEFSEEVAV